MSKDSTSPVGVSGEDIRSLLSERLRKAAGQSHSSPLSFAQHRLWFLDQLEPNSPTYNIPSVCRLIGTLNVAALEHSLNGIVARHEVLRARLESKGGEPVKKGRPPTKTGGLAIRHEDLTAIPENDRDAELERRIGD